MRSPSCTTRSKRLFGTAALLLLCAAATAKTAEAPGNGPVMEIHYGNGAARASLTVDLQATDVYVEMSGRAPHADTIRPSSASVPVQAALPSQQDSRSVARIDSVVRRDSLIRREETRSIVEAAGKAASQDSVTAHVVGGIRRAQEAFYQGRYADAQSLVQGAIEEHPTAEAYALSGSIAWVQKDWVLARRQWTSALALNPEFPGIAGMLARTPERNAP